jgi:hypothetical protein
VSSAMKVRRAKPYVCVDCDYAEHRRFQATRDLDAAAGTWLRCLAYSRAQEQDGVIAAAWLRRTFGQTYERVEELVAVGLLVVRADGDYELRAYAPRNQTQAMLRDNRAQARERMAATRRLRPSDTERAGVFGAEPNSGERARLFGAAEQTANNGACSVQENEPGTSALVRTSTSLSSRSISSSLPSSLHAPSDQDSVSPVRLPLPPSERSLSGPAWLESFNLGVSQATGRPCTHGRVFLATLERVVTHHAPSRDAPSACAWLREQAAAFGRQWDGKSPAKGLTPDGLERWLNEGRRGPPEFGRPRVLQKPAEEWVEDDLSDLHVKVLT